MKNPCGTLAVLSMLLLVGIADASAEAPTLTYLNVNPTAAGSGGQVTITVTVSNTQAFDVVYFQLPNGTQGRLDLGEQTDQGGGTYTATYTVPIGSAAGTWRVAEVGVIGTDNAPYRFLASDLFPNSSACPAFENIGILACGSGMVRDAGAFLVQ